jgi:hypothetical protein
VLPFPIPRPRGPSPRPQALLASLRGLLTLGSALDAPPAQQADWMVAAGADALAGFGAFALAALGPPAGAACSGRQPQELAAGLHISAWYMRLLVRLATQTRRTPRRRPLWPPAAASFWPQSHTPSESHKATRPPQTTKPHALPPQALMLLRLEDAGAATGLLAELLAPPEAPALAVAAAADGAAHGEAPPPGLAILGAAGSSLLAGLQVMGLADALSGVLFTRVECAMVWLG